MTTALEAQTGETALSVGDAIIRALERLGVELMLTIPGGPLMPALECAYRSPTLRTKLVRHEAGGGFMADGYYRATGRMAAVAVTAGPGTTNLATPLALAYREQTPLFALAAQVSTSVYGRGAAQELDTVRVFQSITKAALALTHADRAVDAVCELVRKAQTTPKGPVLLVVPAELFAHPINAASRQALDRISPREPSRIADTRRLADLHALLNTASAPLCLVGRGCVESGAESELLRLAERWPRLLFAATPRAKGAFPESHPRSRGVFGFSGHPAADAALDAADLVLVLGSRLGEISTGGWDERLTRKRIVQLDLDPTEPGRIFPCELPVVGDIRTLLRALLASSEGTATPSSERGVELRVSESGGDVTAGESITRLPSPLDDTSPIKPARAMAAIREALPETAHLFVDIGNSMSWCLHYLVRTVPNRWHVNLTFGAMGHALPAALGARLGTNDPVVAVLGDAALLMTGTELATAAQDRIPVVAIVLNDQGHGMVELGRKLLFADSSIPPMLFDPPPDLAGFARALGVRAWTVTDPVQLPEVLRQALLLEEPCLVDVHIDREVPAPIGRRTATLMSQYDRTSRQDSTAGVES